MARKDKQKSKAIKAKHMDEKEDKAMVSKKVKKACLK